MKKTNEVHKEPYQRMMATIDTKRIFCSSHSVFLSLFLFLCVVRSLFNFNVYACIWLKNYQTDHKILVIAPYSKNQREKRQKEKERARARDKLVKKYGVSLYVLLQCVAITTQTHSRHCMHASIELHVLLMLLHS